jgi:hypothetical protein
VLPIGSGTLCLASTPLLKTIPGKSDLIPAVLSTFLFSFGSSRRKFRGQIGSSPKSTETPICNNNGVPLLGRTSRLISAEKNLSDLQVIKQKLADRATKNTRSDKPSNLIPHDKDHAGDPMSFVSIFHSESTWINIFQSREERNLKKRNESSKQRDEDHHASNHSSIILDDARTLATIFIR